MRLLESGLALVAVVVVVQSASGSDANRGWMVAASAVAFLVLAGGAFLIFRRRGPSTRATSSRSTSLVIAGGALAGTLMFDLVAPQVVAPLIAGMLGGVIGLLEGVLSYRRARGRPAVD